MEIVELLILRFTFIAITATAITTFTGFRIMSLDPSENPPTRSMLLQRELGKIMRHAGKLERAMDLLGPPMTEAKISGSRSTYLILKLRFKKLQARRDSHMERFCQKNRQLREVMRC